MLCIMFHVISHGKPFHKSEGHSHTSVAVYLKLSSYMWSFMLRNDLLCHACFSKKFFYNLFLWKRSSHYIGCKMHPDRKFLFSSPWHSFILHLVFVLVRETAAGLHWPRSSFPSSVPLCCSLNLILFLGIAVSSGFSIVERGSVQWLSPY